MAGKKSKMIEFYKMSGSGNDFIIIDNRDLSLNVGDLPSFVRKVCERKVSVGADGLLLIEPSKSADFKWRFFNSDGSIAEMCGNAARCVARFSCLKGIAGKILGTNRSGTEGKSEAKSPGVNSENTSPASPGNRKK